MDRNLVWAWGAAERAASYVRLLDAELLGLVAIVAIGIAIGSLIMAWRASRGARALRRLHRPPIADPAVYARADPPPVKCHIRTFHYADGHAQSYHSVCQGVDVATMTDAWARSQHPSAALLSVTNDVHRL